MASRLRAGVREIGGAVALDGVPFYQRLEKFCIRTKYGNTNWWHHGVNRCRADAGADWTTYPTLANPLVYEWTKFLAQAIGMVLELGFFSTAGMVEVNGMAEKAKDAWGLPGAARALDDAYYAAASASRSPP